MAESSQAGSRPADTCTSDLKPDSRPGSLRTVTEYSADLQQKFSRLSFWIGSEAGLFKPLACYLLAAIFYQLAVAGSATISPAGPPLHTAAVPISVRACLPMQAQQSWPWHYAEISRPAAGRFGGPHRYLKTLPNLLPDVPAGVCQWQPACASERPVQALWRQVWLPL